jgi:hypothetical protein
MVAIVATYTAKENLMADNENMVALTDAIKLGAKAAREIGKSRERTFQIGEGLMALRSKALIDMGKDPRINDRSILKSGKYRELMGKYLKTYPDYTLETVFKNDSTRLAYMFVAEYKDQILNVFAAEELRNPGATLRLTNPERIKSKFKSLTDAPKKAKAIKEAAAEAEAQDADERMSELRTQRDDAHRAYHEMFDRHVNFDTTPAAKLAELLFDTASSAEGRKNRLAFIDMVVKYATGKEKPESEGKPSPVGKSPRQRRPKKQQQPDVAAVETGEEAGLQA